MRPPLHSARRFITLAAICLASLSFSLAAHANTPAAPPDPAPQNSTPAPTAPPAPVAQQAPAPAARREEEDGNAAPAAPLSIFQRAAAHLQGREAIAQQLAQRDQTIAELRAQLATATAGIASRDAELTELRTGRDQLHTALSQMEGQRTTVTAELAALGFPAAQLPASQTDAQPASLKELAAAVATATTPEARMKAHAAWSAAASRN